jgi:hypothetical protein
MTITAKGVFWLAYSIIFASVPAIAFAGSEGSFERTLKVQGATNVEIESGSGNVLVQRGGSNQVQIVARIRVSNWWGGSSGNADERIKRIEANPPIQQSGNFIRIGHVDDPDLRRNISISYTVTVPVETRLRSHTGSGNQEIRSINGPLDVESGSGNLSVADIGDTVRVEAGSGNIDIDRVKGNVRAHTGSGTIHAKDVAGGFEANAGSGDISLQQTASGAVRVDTGSGGIDLRGVKGSLDAKTGSGDLHAEGEPTGAWTLHTGSGSVNLRLAATSAFDLHAQTGSGSISLASPITVQGSIEKKEIRGKVRGGGVPIEVQTGSGGIDIE